MGDGSPGLTPGGNTQSSLGLGTRLPSHSPARPKARGPLACRVPAHCTCHRRGFPAGEHSQTTSGLATGAGEFRPEERLSRRTMGTGAESSPALPPGRAARRCVLQSPEGSGRMVRGPSGALSVWPLRWFLLSLSHGHLLRGLPGIAPQISSLHWTCLLPRGGGATLEDPSCPPHAWADISHLACSLWAQLFRILPCPSSGQP